MPRAGGSEPGAPDGLATRGIGSAQPPLPENYIYNPSRDSLAIQDGWWIISKYNCTGCHQIAVLPKTALMDLPMYRGENKAKLPPVLIGEGARVTPEWLAEFLHKPPLRPTETHRDRGGGFLQLHMHHLPP